jgi:hypothetical protein
VPEKMPKLFRISNHLLFSARYSHSERRVSSQARIEHQKFLYHLNLGIYFASINKSKHFRQALWFLVCSRIHSPFVL